MGVVGLGSDLKGYKESLKSIIQVILGGESIHANVNQIIHRAFNKLAWVQLI